MTWRCIWGTPFPEHHDEPTQAAAEIFAVAKSGEVGEEVAVIEVRDEEGL